MAPVRDYFTPRPQSYGGRTGSAGPFRESVHCGDDVAWYRDDGTVVSVADGIVRVVSHAYSWGFIVVVEHRLPKKEGAYCSLYGHLAPSVTVAAGQVVRKGQRIGAVGRSHTWENGGYPAHLHFGIHRGPYAQRNPMDDMGAFGTGDGATVQRKLDASWITGYVPPARWDAGWHGWVDPKPFIKARIEGPGNPR
jgi:murein DD-endopeptidase MepM/ murein hydrolase activator NlpD